MQSASRRVKNHTSDSERLRTFLGRNSHPSPVGSRLSAKRRPVPPCSDDDML